MHRTPLALTILSLAFAAGCSQGGGGSGFVAASTAGVTSGASATPTPVGSGSGSSSTTPTGPDTDPPAVVLTSPRRGEMTTQAQVSVEGTITDATGVAYFLVNGNPVLPDPSGAFLEVVTLTPGINVISLEAADPLGHRTRTALSVLSGQFLPEASVVQDAIALRLNRPAFDAIERAAAAQVASMNLAQTVMAQNPLYNGGNSLANVEVNATGATAGTPVVDLDPQAGSVRVRAEVPNVEITVNASGRLIGIPYSVTTRVAMTRAVVTADAVVTVNQGVLTTQLQNVVVDLQGFVFDISHIPTWLEGLAKNAVRNLIERQVVNLVQTTIPQQLNQALAGATGPIQKTVLGRPVTLQVLPQQVDFDADGATVMAASDVVITPPPGLQLPTTPGSLMTPGAPPTSGRARAIYAAANDDLLNRIGHAAWRGGLLNLKVDQALLARQPNAPAWLHLDAFLLTVFFPSLAQQVNPADPLEIELSSLTPPVFTTLPAPDLIEGAIGELTATIYVAPAGQPRVKVLEVSLQAKAGVGVTVTNNATVGVTLTGRPTIATDVISSLIPLDETAVENFVDFVVPPALQLLMGSLSGFPLPTHPSFAPTHLGVSSGGPAGDFVVLEGDL